MLSVSFIFLLLLSFLCAIFFLWLLLDYWFMKWGWLRLILVLYWVVLHGRWVNWEVSGLLELVAVSDVDLLASLLVIEVEGARPLEGSHDSDAVTDFFVVSSGVFLGITHEADNPRGDLLVVNDGHFVVTAD